MYLLFNLMNRVEEIRGKAGGSTYLEISKKNFRDLQIMIPCDELLARFEEVAGNMVKSIENATRSIHRLQEARDRLLPKLISGEIEVSS